MPRTVLFDLDGTIIDSHECIFTVYRRLFSELGLELPPEKEMRRFIGPPIETTIARYVKPEEVADICKRFREIYATVDLLATNSIYDGIAEEMRNIKKAGYKLYLATSKAENVAIEIIKHFGVYDIFDGIYGSRYDLGRSKKWQIIDAIIEDTGVSKDDCILIGDTIFDAEGAEKSGIRVAIVNYGFGEKEDFIGKEIAFFADMGEITANLEKLN